MKKPTLILPSKLILALFIGFLSTASIFYACKKHSAEAVDINENYKRELQTYHDSKDYKNLLIQYPNREFVDLPILDVKDKVKAIVTNIITDSDEVLRAITYFEPEKGFNTWYPTFIVHAKAKQVKILMIC